MKSGKSIIIVEDEYLIAIDTKMALEEAGYAVSGIATSGEQAVSMFREHHPSLVLMDIALAGNMDGIQAVEEIRRDSDVPVIFVSGNLDEKNIQRIESLQSCSWIAKPCDDARLRSAVEQAFGRVPGF